MTSMISLPFAESSVDSITTKGVPIAYQIVSKDASGTVSAIGRSLCSWSTSTFFSQCMVSVYPFLSTSSNGSISLTQMPNVPTILQSISFRPIANSLSNSDICSYCLRIHWTATAGSDVVQSGRLIFDDFFQHLWPYIGNNTANVVFQMVKRLWLIRIDH
ncbi:hypothetical protein TNCV_3330601 [Trichonephila clavipes]|nr:hypothetical protein TNCV_3330601 [Trichonephila clavipes]